MQTDEDIEKIKVKLEGAFKPLFCVAEVWDYKQKLRFKVCDVNHEVIIEMPEVALRKMGDQGRLQDLIQEARAQVLTKGHVLD